MTTQCFRNPELCGFLCFFRLFFNRYTCDLAILKGVWTVVTLIQAFSWHSSLGRLDWIYVGGGFFFGSSRLGIV